MFWKIYIITHLLPNCRIVPSTHMLNTLFHNYMPIFSFRLSSDFGLPITLALSQTNEQSTKKKKVIYKQAGYKPAFQ